MPATDTHDLPTRVREVALEALAERPDLYIVEVKVRGQQGSRVVEVYVDADEGVSLDELARVSREIEFLLDTEDVIKGRYNLNVSSPGADRPLVEPRQYRKHIGRELQVAWQDGEDQRTESGTLLRADDASLDLEVRGTTLTIAFADVTDARVLLPW